MRIQLWSYNYDPEPTGIGPVSTTLAEGLTARGHRVEVIAAHPHYPAPVWGSKFVPYRELRNGIPVLRLPLWIGRKGVAQRYRQELTFMTAQLLATPALGSPDILISASPSFPALLPAMVNARLRRLPWIIWLHDILPDGAAATGLINRGVILSAAEVLERSAYRSADRIVVLSRAFIDNLVAKGVPAEKIRLIYDPATRCRSPDVSAAPSDELRVLSMGNIGFSQGLAPLVAAFERCRDLADLPVKLIITGNGTAAGDVAREVKSSRVEMLGLVDDQRLERELQTATVALVSQKYDGPEFNIPSKLMNFMEYGLPILAAVNPRGEVARIVQEAGAGWVAPSAEPDAFPRKLVELVRQPVELRLRAAAASAYAKRHFSQQSFAEHFDAAVQEVVR